MDSMFKEGKMKNIWPSGLCGFSLDMLKKKGIKHEPKGNLGSLHKTICRNSLPIKPAYKALLGCTCASGRMYTSDDRRESGKKDIFLMRGIL